MKRRQDARAGLAAITLAGLFAGTIACGKRGDPLPPLRPVPGGVEVLIISQRGPSIVLEWEAPRQNRDGSTVVDLEEVEILRRVMDVPEEPEPEPEAESPEEPEEPEELEQAEQPPEQQEEQREEAPQSAGSPDVDAAAEPSEAPPPPPPFASEAEVIASLDSAAAGEPMSFRDPWGPSWENKRIEYAVRHRNRAGRWGPLSPVAFIDPLPPLSPPAELDAEAGDALVRLQWSSPVAPTAAEGSGGQPSFAFDIFRRGDEGPYPPAPINPAPVPGSSYEDRSAVFGQRWCYVVRTVAMAREPERAEGERAAEEAPAPPPPGRPAPSLIESVDSVEVCLTPVDTFPPPVPTDLVAVESEGGILLSWSEVEAADLGGYVVYRARQPRGPFERVTAGTIGQASFTDRTVEAGVVYHYAVSAVDRAEPPNESSRSRTASAKAP